MYCVFKSVSVSAMKLGSSGRLIGVVALILCAVAAISLFEHIPPQRLAALLGISVSVSDRPTGQSPSPSESPSTHDGLIAEAVVSVQTFLGPTLVRQGSGISVSSDGLVLTNAATAPYGSGTYVYQVVLSRGDVLRASRVAYDSATGLVLLKIDGDSFDAVLFDESVSLSAGMQLEAISADIQFVRFFVKRLPVWVVWNNGSQVELSMDRALGGALHGARIADQYNRSLGVLSWSGKPTLIDAKKINRFIDTYLARVVRD